MSRLKEDQAPAVECQTLRLQSPEALNHTITSPTAETLNPLRHLKLKPQSSRLCQSDFLILWHGTWGI